MRPIIFLDSGKRPIARWVHSFRVHGSDLNICSRIFISFVVRGINFFLTLASQMPK
jgi:hypothetical protein